MAQFFFGHFVSLKKEAFTAFFALLRHFMTMMMMIMIMIMIMMMMMILMITMMNMIC